MSGATRSTCSATQREAREMIGNLQQRWPERVNPNSSLIAVMLLRLKGDAEQFVLGRR